MPGYIPRIHGVIATIRLGWRVPPAAVNRVTNCLPPLLHSAHGPILTSNATLPGPRRANPTRGNRALTNALFRLAN
jgi:hypothetical protein